MLSYPWSLGEITIMSTIPNSSSRLTPSIIIQFVPQATAINELYQVHFSSPIPQRPPRSRCTRPRPLGHRICCGPNWVVWVCGFPSELPPAPGGQQPPQSQDMQPTSIPPINWNPHVGQGIFELTTVTYGNSLVPTSQPAGTKLKCLWTTMNCFHPSLHNLCPKQLLQAKCTKSISPAQSLGKRLDPYEADIVVGQIEALEGAVFLQSFCYLARTGSPHRPTQPKKYIIEGVWD